MKIRVSVVLVAMLSLGGCASILNEQTQPINVSTTSGGPIKGKIDGVPFTGPGVVNVVRQNKNKVMTVETPGCAPEVVLEKTVDNKFFINVLIGGGFGSTTDYASEKMWKYSENVVVSCKK